MSLKESNEITVKIKCGINELYKILEEKGFKIVDIFSMNDIYFIPENLDIEKMSVREIISKAILVREIETYNTDNIKRMITYKIKEFDSEGNILTQKAFNCKIYDIEEARILLKAIGYKEIMIIKENDKVFEKEGFELAIKDIENGDKLIEVETEDNEEYDTIEKLKNKINEINIPIYTDNYFIKKAEVELNKILKR